MSAQPIPADPLRPEPRPARLAGDTFRHVFRRHAAGVAVITVGGAAPLESAANTPRPCVAATSVVPIQNISSTDTFAGPSCGRSQVEPPSRLTKTPTSVPA